MTDLQLFIMQLFTNPVLLCAVFSWLTAQFIKLFTTPNYRHDRSILQVFFGSGGMPSSHSAAVCALCFSCAIQEGLGSPIFAIAFVLAGVVMIDASGVRYETGKQAKIINQITKKIFSDNLAEVNSGLKELVGHTPFQVLMGAGLGAVTAIVTAFVMGVL